MLVISSIKSDGCHTMLEAKNDLAATHINNINPISHHNPSLNIHPPNFHFNLLQNHLPSNQIIIFNNNFHTQNQIKRIIQISVFLSYFILQLQLLCVGERPEAMQTGSSITPTSTCFLTTTIAIIIGSLGAVSGNCNPFPQITKMYHTMYDILIFILPKFSFGIFNEQQQWQQQQRTFISITAVVVLATIFTIANRCLQIMAELPSG